MAGFESDSTVHGVTGAATDDCCAVTGARILPKGIKAGNTVYVTELLVSALLALESPFGFAGDSPRSFLWTTNATPLAPGANAYFAQTERHELASSLALSDAQWFAIEPFCAVDCIIKPGRPVRTDLRALVESFILRAVTGGRWADVTTSPLVPRNVSAAWFTWRRDGRLQRVLEAAERTGVEQLRHAIADFGRSRIALDAPS